MKKQRSGIAKWLAVIGVVVVVLSLPIAVLVFDLGRVIFNPPLVKQLLTDEVVRSELLPIVLEWFSDRRADERVSSGEALTGIDEPDVVLLMSFLDREDWKAIKNEVLTDEILIEWVSQTVDGFYAWIDSADRVPQITWSMQPFKDRVDSEHGSNSIVIAFTNLTDCTQAEIDDFLSRQAAVPAGTEVLYNLCRFPDPWYEDQFGDYLRALQDVVGNVPPQFKLTQEVAALQNPEGAGPENIKQQLRLIRLWMNLLWLLPAAFLLLILLLAVRSGKELGRWWGAALLVGGMFTLLPAVVYRALITFVVSSGPLSEIPDQIKAEAQRIALKLADAVFQPMLLQAVVILALGLILLVVGMLIKPVQEAQ